MLQNIQEKVAALVNWVNEMKKLNQNPYGAGLNVTKVLNDLGDFATELLNDLQKLENESTLPEGSVSVETETPDSATVEQ